MNDVGRPLRVLRGRDGDGRVGSSIKEGNVLVYSTPVCYRVGRTTAAAAVDNCLGVERNTQAVNNNGNCSGKKVGYSVQNNKNGSSSAYTNFSTRTIPLSMCELLLKKKKHFF